MKRKLPTYQVLIMSFVPFGVLVLVFVFRAMGFPWDEVGFAIAAYVVASILLAYAGRDRSTL